MLRSRRASTKGQRSQAMPEFALVAPILFLLIFGVFDFGRGIYDYITIQTAANEAARAAVQGEPEVLGQAANPAAYKPFLFYTDATADAVAQTAVRNTAGLNLIQAPSCPYGPIPSLANLSTPPGKGGLSVYIPPNQGWVFVTSPTGDPSTWGGKAADCQGGGNQATSIGQDIQVTVVYHYSPITPIISNVIGQNLLFPIYSVYHSEYRNN